jgi:hypothetical protein
MKMKIEMTEVACTATKKNTGKVLLWGQPIKLIQVTSNSE